MWVAGMKEHSGKKPKIRVVDDGPSGGDVVRLGTSEEVVRLGEKGAEPVDNAILQRLEVATTAGIEARDVTVEEILDQDGEVESPDGPLEESWGGEGKRWMAVPWGWFVAIGLICVGLAVWSLRHIFQHRHESRLAMERATRAIEEDRRRDEQAESLYQRLEQAVTNYLASSSVEDRLRHVRNPERVAPLMRDWYREQPLEPEEIINLGAFTPVTLDKGSFWVVAVETLSGGRKLLVEQTREDDGRVDWEMDVCYQPMDWDRFVNESPEGKFEFRVLVRADNFYVYEFQNQAEYRSFRLTTLGSEEHLYGYVPRGSVTDERILSLLGKRLRTAPMILELEFLPDVKARRSVVISDVVSATWWVSEDAP